MSPCTGKGKWKEIIYKKCSIIPQYYLISVVYFLKGILKVYCWKLVHQNSILNSEIIHIPYLENFKHVKEFINYLFIFCWYFVPFWNSIRKRNTFKIYWKSTMRSLNYLSTAIESYLPGLSLHIELSKNYPFYGPNGVLMMDDISGMI